MRYQCFIVTDLPVTPNSALAQHHDTWWYERRTGAVAARACRTCRCSATSVRYAVVTGTAAATPMALALGRRAHRISRVHGAFLGANSQGIVDESTLPWVRSWRHERHLEALAGGCRLTDHLIFTPQYPWMGPSLHSALLYLFRHRHRRRLQQAIHQDTSPPAATMRAVRSGK